jgi:hypothetical protein
MAALNDERISWHNVLTTGAGSLLAVHLILKYGATLAGAPWPQPSGLDPIALALVIVALLPWIAAYLTSAKLPGGIEFAFREVQRRQTLNEQAIRQLRFIVNGFATRREYELLHNIRDNLEYDIGQIDIRDDSLETDLRRLLAFGLIERIVESRGVGAFTQRENEKRRIGEYFRLTPQGEEYLKMRDGSTE